MSITPFLGKKETQLKSGNEYLQSNGKTLPFSLLEFWRWSVSDLLSNATRGRFAEFIVATAIDVDITSCRDEWAAFDLVTPTGIKLEIKSSAYLQSWHQKRLSSPSFSIKPATFWDGATGTYATDKARHGDAYVFCFLHHQDKATVDPSNMDQWEFYVVSTKLLNDQYSRASSISLKVLRNMAKPVGYTALKEAVEHYNDSIPNCVE